MNDYAALLEELGTLILGINYPAAYNVDGLGYHCLKCLAVAPQIGIPLEHRPECPWPRIIEIRNLLGNRVRDV